MNSKLIKSCEIFNASAAIDDQPTEHKESQQVPGFKIERYIQALFSNTLTFSGGCTIKKVNIARNKT